MAKITKNFQNYTCLVYKIDLRYKCAKVVLFAYKKEGMDNILHGLRIVNLEKIMSSTFGYKALSLAVVSALAATSAHSAGLDRSGQDVTAFLQDGTYAEAVYTYIDADVSGKDASGNVVPDGAEAYDFFRFGVKGDLNDRFSVGVLYDEPFGAAVQYSGDNNFVSQGAAATAYALSNSESAIALRQGIAQLNDGIAQLNAGKTQLTEGKTQLEQGIALTTAAGGDATALQNRLQDVEAQLQSVNQRLDAANTRLNEVTALAAQSAAAATRTAATSEAQKGEGTNVEIRTHNLTTLVGMKLGEKRNFQIYGGAAAQHLTGEVHLRGIAYQAAQGYDARISPDTAVGWVAGVAYSKPEIALKAALTYRSEIEHESTIAEVFPATARTTTRNFAVTLPESYNLDFQTGVNPTTLLTARVRYVPWSDFDIRPPTYGDATAIQNNGVPLPIISYSDDQWSAEVGLGKRVSDRLALSGSVGWDSGAGNPASTLGPIEGYWSLGLGAKYNVTPEWSVSVGGKYLKFGDATANLPNGMTAGEFSDNDGFIAGVKLAYQAK